MGSGRLSCDTLIGCCNGVWSGNSSTKHRAGKRQDARYNSDPLNPERPEARNGYLTRRARPLPACGAPLADILRVALTAIGRLLRTFRAWLQRTNLWRERTNLRTGPERLNGCSYLQRVTSRQQGVVMER